MKPDLTLTLLQLKSKPRRLTIQLTILIIMNACSTRALVNVRHLLKDQAQKHDKRCMYYLYFSVHELSDDETRPDDHSVTTAVETA